MENPDPHQIGPYENEMGRNGNKQTLQNRTTGQVIHNRSEIMRRSTDSGSGGGTATSKTSEDMEPPKKRQKITKNDSEPVVVKKKKAKPEVPLEEEILSPELRLQLGIRGEDQLCER